MITIPPVVVCVAPSDGRARALAEPGADVEAGDLVAIVDSEGRSAAVHAPTRGRVAGALTGTRQAVSRGEAVLWLSR